MITGLVECDGKESLLDHSLCYICTFIYGCDSRHKCILDSASYVLHYNVLRIKEKDY